MAGLAPGLIEDGAETAGHGEYLLEVLVAAGEHAVQLVGEPLERGVEDFARVGGLGEELVAPGRGGEQEGEPETESKVRGAKHIFSHS